MTENRDSFLTRLHDLPGSVIFSEDESARIELAYDLSKEAHRWQKRKDGTRYFEHPRRSTLTLIDRLHVYDVACIIAMLLHDGYEDSPRHVTPVKVEILGGPEAARIIRLVSKRPKEGYADRLLRLADWKSLVVKLCDRHDNLSDLDSSPAAFKEKQFLETRDVYLPIFDRLVAIVPEMHREAVTGLVLEVQQLVAGGLLGLAIASS